ncbi:hypothetical protein N7499_004078 [Penicillium canescens]|nr:hypothetical protein N7499_004078 [Penicillium canescens]KAJ6181492.1 hypothetical protein N7485_000134 [Penicillium canescens]
MSHKVVPSLVNAVSSTGPQPIDDVASSQRCAVSGCGKWAIAQSRFCADLLYGVKQLADDELVTTK